MPGSLTYKLQSFESLPPPEVWDKIAQRLTAECPVTDMAVEQKLYEAEITAPPLAWPSISAAINTQLPEKRTSVIPMRRKLAVAAAVAVLLGAGAIYFISVSRRQTAPFLAAKNGERQRNNIVSADSRSSIPSAASALPSRPSSAAIAPRRIVLAASRQTGKSAVYRYIAAQTSARFPEENISPADIPPIQSAVMTQPVAVEAPPLRDKEGNIIMDIRLITSPDNKHIVVTGPNGEQTRISNKFLSCLSYLNSAMHGENNAEARECKTRFQEWREQLLQEDAFIPSAANFFDILELKDMIREE